MRKFLLALGMSLAGALSANSQTAEQTTEWEGVVAAAKAEGTVVMYTGQVGQPQNKMIADAFEAKYGISVQILEARASELAERIRTEQVSGRVQGDVSHNGGSSAVTLERAGFYADHGYLPDLGRLKPEFKSNGQQFALFVQPYAALVNSRLVPEEDRPKNWADLLDPRWKGKILADDFRAAGGGSAFFNVSYRVLGAEFHEKLAAQQIVFSRQIRDNPRRVARGEFLVYLPFSLPDITLNDGLPLAPVIPAEGAPYITYDGAVFKNAPHPNAARLLLNFFLSDEVQMFYVNSGRGATINGLDDRIPENLKYISSATLMGEPDPDASQKLFETAKEIYK